MQNELFTKRHIGPSENDIQDMLDTVGVDSVEQLINETIPESIRLDKPIDLPEHGMSEQGFLSHIKEIAGKNKVYKSYIGQGYYDTVFPSVIKRNVFENPGWYTSYTPYQAEISQGRLEALLNFQTAISELTGMEIANSSLLDEATSAAEAMSLMFDTRKQKDIKAGKNKLFVDKNIFPQTLDVILMRAEPIGVEVVVDNYIKFPEIEDGKFFGSILQYPAADGTVNDYSDFASKAHEAGILVTAIVDIMSLAILKKPSDWDADVVVGNTQRFGIPMGFGGPHAAFLATSAEYKRNIPGRIIGVSKDKFGKPGLRMALQTREQHIKRERATSNICTAQALLATMAGFYAVYHGPEGLKEIAGNIHKNTSALAKALNSLGYKPTNTMFFDTLNIPLPDGIKSHTIKDIADTYKINFNIVDENTIRISLDETTTINDLNDIIRIFAKAANKTPVYIDTDPENITLPESMMRNDKFMQQEVFHAYRSETEMMRYMKKLERRDIALNHSMIPLGSCTMKLNSATSMLPLSWEEFGSIHPFAPAEQWTGYKELMDALKADLARITGFYDISFQPNSGASGEHTGLMVIRAYHIDNNEAHRNVCLVPSSAHGTNPASSVMAGMKVVSVDSDSNGNISLDDLKKKADEHKNDLAACMITYPSTHGVFESNIKDMIKIVHDHGGLVYMDGANMNAQLCITHPCIIGADVCHLNLHKTFGIPHGGGGPGVGPIGVTKELSHYLPGHSVVQTGGDKAIKAVAAAPFGSASILPITYAFIKMLGREGLKKSAEISILNANYIASALKDWYEVLYTGEKGRCAHEMILNCQHFQKEYHVSAGNIAKRLMDFGFHAPTLSFPVHETLMVEPTESESKKELDHFIEAMIQIRKELDKIKDGTYTADDNPVINAPHTAEECLSSDWKHAYDRKTAAYPLNWVRENKFWTWTAEIDQGYGDRHLFCTCETLEAYK
ncbi:MAG: aminomethyl-transferring glycine dehydrogenase [Bacteroidales bacterium]